MACRTAAWDVWLCARVRYVWRLVRECRAFTGRAGGALIGEERCLTESGSRIFDDNSPMRSCLSLGDVDALDLPLLLYFSWLLWRLKA